MLIVIFCNIILNTIPIYFKRLIAHKSSIEPLDIELARVYFIYLSQCMMKPKSRGMVYAPSKNSDLSGYQLSDESLHA